MKNIETVLHSEQHLTEFFDAGGHMVAVTDDHRLVSLFRSHLVKHLSMDKDCITSAVKVEGLENLLAERYERHSQILVLLEHSLNRRENNYVLTQLKERFDQIKVVVLLGAVESHTLVLLHDLGADNFITRPYTINSLLEKVAMAIKPRGRFAQMVSVGQMLIQSGEYRKALHLGHQLHEANPKNPGAFLLMGDALKGLGKFDMAVKAYERACRVAHMYLEPIKKLAQLHKETRNYEKQLEYLESLDRLSPRNLFRKVDIGEAHVELGNSEQAEIYFGQAIDLSASEIVDCIVEMTEKIADVYAKKDYAKAEVYYRKALELRGDNLRRSDVGVFNRLGIALRKQGKWGEAVKEYERALKVSPEDENLYYNIALAYADGRQYLKSSEYIAKALDLNPSFYEQDAMICYNTGVIYARLRDKKTATAFIEHSLRLNPSFASARKLLEDLTGAASA